MVTRAHLVDSEGRYVIRDFSEVPALIRAKDRTVWIETDERRAEVESFLQEQMGIHPLTVEDIFFDQPTPKVEDYGDILYIVLHGIHREAQDPESLGTVEIDILIGPTWVFTHHPRSMRSVEGLRAELERNPRALLRGSAYVAHAIIDRLADDYYPVIEAFDDDIDEVSRQIIEEPVPDILTRLFALRRSLQALRRVSTYQRDVLLRLSRGEFGVIPEHALPFFRDAYDHFVRIADHADSYRELVNASVEMYMSSAANRTNEIMRVLAIISTIMLPLSFIAGVYGMNFEYMPELRWRWGYLFVWGLMVLVVVGLLTYFRRKRWL
ncbi:MAG TPA: magnesium/cobalt transporter CorA [Polyangiaceae bacterium]|jgi:magnesium transporter|nr:MAG: Magnesium transport protein CorA [Deltaproteobacteria bacterium ADurb.Bin207]HNS97151.1 magnesium/cobalt transporter CorA [Polyangiaceae bacterium]HNZ22184.1 magnesium/cobalt transporter CorA [Polyangiaceae bacterium]HOD23973.1 magnesium/cobalt transporter CorA [Polyangiaceae bacterium]HOE47008.1 magnesium/cobalt transporter CorA [Polyangiaceae bacterium]